MKYVIIAVIILVVYFIPRESAGAIKYSKQPANKMTWTESTKKLHKTIVSQWMNYDIAKYLINKCKETAKDARKCVIHASMISKAESNMGRDAVNGNMFWITWYKWTLKGAIDTWVWKYNKYWYNNTKPSDYYKTSNSHLPRSRYCMSEYQPDGTHLNYCKNGIKHSTYIFNLLTYER